MQSKETASICKEEEEEKNNITRTFHKLMLLFKPCRNIYLWKIIIKCTFVTSEC